MEAWGYPHKTVCHARGEYARDEAGDGVCEVHGNTIEGFWSLLRSWWRPHRGIAQEKLPLYLGFVQCVHAFTTNPRGEKPCSVPSSPPWSHDRFTPPRIPGRAFLDLRIFASGNFAVERTAAACL